MSFNLTSHSVWYRNETIHVTSSVFKWNPQWRQHCRVFDVYRSEFCVKEEDASALFRLKCALVYPLGKFQEIRRIWNWVRLLSFCSVLMMIIYWGKTNILCVKDIEDGNSWLLANSLVTNERVKVWKIHTSQEGKFNPANESNVVFSALCIVSCKV
jgi:hypothetical protein